MSDSNRLLFKGTLPETYAWIARLSEDVIDEKDINSITERVEEIDDVKKRVKVWHGSAYGGIPFSVVCRYRSDLIEVIHECPLLCQQLKKALEMKRCF